MKPAKIHYIGVVLVLATACLVYWLINQASFLGLNNGTDKQRRWPPLDETYQPDLDDLKFVEMQISSVVIDMQRYLGWFPDDKNMMKKAAVKAIDDLINIKNYLNQLKFTNDLTDLKDISISALDSLVKIYDGIELKSLEDIGAEFASFNEMGVTRLPLCCCIVS